MEHIDLRSFLFGVNAVFTGLAAFFLIEAYYSRERSRKAEIELNALIKNQRAINKTMMAEAPRPRGAPTA